MPLARTPCAAGAARPQARRRPVVARACKSEGRRQPVGGGELIAENHLRDAHPFLLDGNCTVGGGIPEGAEAGPMNHQHAAVALERECPQALKRDDRGPSGGARFERRRRLGQGDAPVGDRHRRAAGPEAALRGGRQDDQEWQFRRHGVGQTIAPPSTQGAASASPPTMSHA